MDNSFVEKDISRSGMLLILLMIPVLFLAAGIGCGLAYGNLISVIAGLKDIILSPTILITDFIRVGGMEAAFINVAILGFINIYLIYRFRLGISGVLTAAFFTVIGFSFFGKNVYNILPIYLGGYLYTRYQRISFREVIVVEMFGTALAPIISEISFAGFLPPHFGIPAAIISGIFLGFIMVPLSTHMLKFHDGYNLYNIGFTSGIIGTVMTSFLRGFGVAVEPVSIISEENHMVIIGLLAVLFLGLMLAGLVINPRAVIDYPKILSYRGRLITDFTHVAGYGATYLNMAVLGFACLIYVTSIGGVINGPVLAGIFTVVGFGALGKHVKNCLPVTLGVIATALVLGCDLTATSIIISVLFSTTLAPISGTYGPVAGFAAGVLHMFLVSNVSGIHGGVNLYNNGFSGGIAASVMIPVIDAFKKERKNAARIKKNSTNR